MADGETAQAYQEASNELYRMKTVARSTLTRQLIGEAIAAADRKIRQLNDAAAITRTP